MGAARRYRRNTTVGAEGTADARNTWWRPINIPQWSPVSRWRPRLPATVNRLAFCGFAHFQSIAGCAEFPDAGGRSKGSRPGERTDGTGGEAQLRPDAARNKSW